jgi:hypothetical protein
MTTGMPQWRAICQRGEPPQITPLHLGSPDPYRSELGGLGDWGRTTERGQEKTHGKRTN